MGNPAEIRARAVRRQKTGTRDADHLLDLRLKRFPRIWVPTPTERVKTLSPVPNATQNSNEGSEKDEYEQRYIRRDGATCGCDRQILVAAGRRRKTAVRHRLDGGHHLT